MESWKCDAFLSYNIKDDVIVKEIARRLKEEGLMIWLGDWDLIPGQPRQEAIEEALQQSRAILIFIGETGFSDWENEEMRVAVESRISDPDRIVIPVLLPGANEETLAQKMLLRRHIPVDFMAGLDDRVALHRLVSGVIGKAPGDIEKQKSAEKKSSRPKTSKLKASEQLPFVDRETIVELIYSIHAPAYHFIDAPAGFGKTTVMKKLQQQFEEGKWLCAYVSITDQKSAGEIVLDIANQLNISLTGNMSGSAFAEALVSQRSADFNGSAGKRGVIVFLDVEKSWASALSIVQQILKNFIPQTVEKLRELGFRSESTNPFRAVIASRYLTGKFPPHSISLNPVPHKLPPFSYNYIRESVGKYLYPHVVSELDQLTAHLMYYTAGHPGCIANVLGLYKQKNYPPPDVFFEEYEEAIWEIVYPEIEDIRHGIENELRLVFDDLSVYRFLDPPILGDLLERTPFLEFIDEFDLQDKLRNTYLLDTWKGGYFLRDSFTRKLISLRLLNDNGSRAFAHYCNRSQATCKSRMENLQTQMPDIWLAEYLYQYLQQYSGEIQDAEVRARIRGQFFSTIIPEAFALFAKDRIPRQFRLSIESILNEDWELQFTINYFLRETEYTEKENSPYMLMRAQILDLFR